MSIKRLFAGIAGFAVLSVAVVQVHGFVNDATDFPYVEDSSRIVEMIDDIAANLEAEDAIEKIDAAITELDEVLDSEPQNEGEILELRDALVDLRVKASDEIEEGDQTELAQIVDAVSPAPAPLLSAPATYSAPVVTYSGGGGVAAGGGGVAAGINWRRIALIGGLVAGLASIDGDDDDVQQVSIGMP